MLFKGRGYPIAVIVSGVWSASPSHNLGHNICAEGVSSLLGHISFPDNFHKILKKSGFFMRLGQIQRLSSRNCYNSFPTFMRRSIVIIVFLFLWGLGDPRAFQAITVIIVFLFLWGWGDSRGFPAIIRVGLIILKCSPRSSLYCLHYFIYKCRRIIDVRNMQAGLSPENRSSKTWHHLPSILKVSGG